MKKIIDLIIHKCLEFEIPVKKQININGDEVCFVSTPSESGVAKLICKEEFITCEIDNKVDIILNFLDLSYVVKKICSSKDKHKELKKKQSPWFEVFRKYKVNKNPDDLDLPF